MKGILVVVVLALLLYFGYTSYEKGIEQKQEQMQQQDKVVDETSDRVRDQLNGIQKKKNKEEE